MAQDAAAVRHVVKTFLSAVGWALAHAEICRRGRGFRLVLILTLVFFHILVGHFEPMLPIVVSSDLIGTSLGLPFVLYSKWTFRRTIREVIGIFLKLLQAPRPGACAGMVQFKLSLYDVNICFADVFVGGGGTLTHSGDYDKGQ
jgi:hypothetical protein